MYTKGPWVVDNPNSHLIAQMVDGTYHYIASTEPGMWSTTERTIEEIEANAHLIAAAPDLLDALAEILDYRGGADNALEDPYVMERAMAAIAKAEGRQP